MKLGQVLVLAASVCSAVLAVGAAAPQQAHGAGSSISLQSADLVATTARIERAAPARQPETRILSTPDFLNADVGDLRGLRRWNGRHNSTNRTYERSLRVVLNQFRRERPDHVLVAGDLIEGHWGVDVSRTGVFGPVRTRAQRLRAVRRAGHTYYGQWKQRFRRHGLPMPHIAVGDHEIGDDPWPRGSFDARAVPTYKRVVADHLIGGRYPASRRPVGTPFARTSYWQPLGPQVALLSVDVFEHRRSGRPAVRPAVTGAHLRWFRRTLRHLRREYRWVIVQGHTPVVGKVRARGSSKLMLHGGRRSPFWRAMLRHDVDLYLAGEVHSVTAVAPRRGPVQITHGGLFAYGGTNYLLIDQYPDRLELSAHGFEARVSKGRRMWQTSWKRAVPRQVRYRRGTRLLGHATLRANGRLVKRSGFLSVASQIGNRR